MRKRSMLARSSLAAAMASCGVGPEGESAIRRQLVGLATIEGVISNGGSDSREALSYPPPLSEWHRASASDAGRAP